MRQESLNRQSTSSSLGETNITGLHGLFSVPSTAAAVTTADVTTAAPLSTTGPAGVDDMDWVPTGDPQLDSLLHLKSAVDTNDLLTGWRVKTGRNGGFCSWEFVTCDKSGSIVEVSHCSTEPQTGCLSEA